MHSTKDGVVGPARDDRPRLPATAVCKHFGIVRRTLTRWVDDDELNFPAPVVINGRWYFVVREIEDFEERQRAVAREVAKCADQSGPGAEPAQRRPGGEPQTRQGWRLKRGGASAEPEAA